MKNLEKLTDSQIAKLPQYTKKWIDIGLSTENISQKEIERIINNFQTIVLGNKTLLPIVVKPSPVSAWKFIQEHTGSNEKFVAPYQDGSFFSSVFSLYDFFISEGIVKISILEKYKAWEETSKLGMIYPLDDVYVVTKKPTQIHLDSLGRLHNENGKALEYEDWGFYSLNGVRVPEYLVMTPSEELSLDFFKKQTNADIKAEFVRKFGVERMLDFGKKVDTYENYDQEEQSWWWKSEYELWDMAVLFEGLNYQPYLKMKNQTTGIWHVEAVSPACITVGEAIKERFSGQDLKIIAIA